MGTQDSSKESHRFWSFDGASRPLSFCFAVSSAVYKFTLHNIAWRRVYQTWHWSWREIAAVYQRLQTVRMQRQRRRRKSGFRQVGIYCNIQSYSTLLLENAVNTCQKRPSPGPLVCLHDHWCVFWRLSKAEAGLSAACIMQTNFHL